MDTQKTRPYRAVSLSELSRLYDTDKAFGDPEFFMGCVLTEEGEEDYTLMVATAERLGRTGMVAVTFVEGDLADFTHGHTVVLREDAYLALSVIEMDDYWS